MRDPMQLLAELENIAECLNQVEAQAAHLIEGRSQPGR
jgi:hypothetical protein